MPLFSVHGVPAASSPSPVSAFGGWLRHRFRKNTPRRLKLIVACAGSALAMATLHAEGSARTWKNSGTDFNTPGNWNTTTPGTGDVASFTTSETAQPNLSAPLSIAGLYFNGATSSGYDITNTNNGTFTLTGYSPTGSSGTSNGNAAAIRSEITSGLNKVEVPITLAPASASTSVFYQVAGGTLDVSGAITGSGDLSLKGAGSIELDGTNSSLANSSIDQASTTVLVGNNSALGTNLNVSSTAFLVASGGARTLATNVIFAGSTTLSGSNAFTFNGTTTSSGSSSRTLTVNNTGGLTLGGNVYLSESDSTARALIINGSSSVNITGVIANNNVGNTLASNFGYSGTGAITVSNSNTYTGTTSISSGRFSITNTSGSATGTGAVGLNTGTATLTGTGSSSGLLTVISGGHIAPGSNTSGSGNNFGNTGTLGLGTSGGITLTSANLDLDLGATANIAHDHILTGGTLTLTSVMFNFNELTGALQTNTPYQLISGYANSNITFSGLTATTIGQGYSAAFSESAPSGVNELDVTFSVPEPASICLLGFASAAALLRRTRRPSNVDRSRTL